MGIAGKPDLASAAPAVREVLEPAVDYSAWGVPRMIRALGKPLPMAPLGDQAEECGGECVAYRLFSEYDSDFPIFDWQSVEFTEIGVDQGPLGWKVYRVVQSLYGVPVRNSDMVFHVDQNGAIRYFHGNFYPDYLAQPLHYVMEYDEALAKANASLSKGEEVQGLVLQYVDTSISMDGPPAIKPMWLVYSNGRVLKMDGVTGLLAGEEQLDAMAFQAERINVDNYKALAGTTSMTAPVYLALAMIYTKFSQWGWDGYDGNGSVMRVYDNYCLCTGTNNDECFSPTNQCDCHNLGAYPSCFSITDGRVEPQLAFWYSGSDAYNFQSQSPALGSGPFGAGVVVGANNSTLDVLAHEFGHGFNQATSQLIYQYEPGALAEGFADCFAAMVDTANWTLFESTGFSSYHGTGAIRSLEDPNSIDLVAPGYVSQSNICSQAYGHYGTAASHYLQRASCSKDEDYGCVHEDSGLIAKACWLLGNSATNTFSGVTVQGQGRAATGYVFHYAQRSFLTSTSLFSDARAALTSAALLYDNSQNDTNFTMTIQTDNAMDAVGIWAHNGNIAGSLRSRTKYPVAPIEQPYGTGTRRFVFYRHEDGSNSRLKYLRFAQGLGWARLELPTQIPMREVPPVTLEAVTSGGVVENSVIYPKSDWSLTRVRIRNGVVLNPASTENLSISASKQVGGVSAGGLNYGIAHINDRNDRLMITYLTRSTIDSNLSKHSTITVVVDTSPQSYLYPLSGVSLTRGDGRVWLAYRQREDIGSGQYAPGPLCVTHISETEFAWNYSGSRVWAEPTCFDAPVCYGGSFDAIIEDALRGPLLYSYAPNGQAERRYYLGYTQLRNRWSKRPVIYSFTWDNSTQTISNPTRPVMLPYETGDVHCKYVNSLGEPQVCTAYTGMIGSVLVDSENNLRLYYIDSEYFLGLDPQPGPLDLGNFISELMKNGY